jgi:hypothetical protein
MAHHRQAPMQSVVDEYEQKVLGKDVHFLQEPMEQHTTHNGWVEWCSKLQQTMMGHLQEVCGS